MHETKHTDGTAPSQEPTSDEDGRNLRDVQIATSILQGISEKEFARAKGEFEATIIESTRLMKEMKEDCEKAFGEGYREGQKDTAARLDSFNIGTPGKEGTTKFYFDAGRPADAVLRARAAFDITEYARMLYNEKKAEVNGDGLPMASGEKFDQLEKEFKGLTVAKDRMVRFLKEEAEQELEEIEYGDPTDKTGNGGSDGHGERER